MIIPRQRETVQLYTLSNGIQLPAVSRSDCENLYVSGMMKGANCVNGVTMGLINDIQAFVLIDTSYLLFSATVI